MRSNVSPPTRVLRPKPQIGRQTQGCEHTQDIADNQEAAAES